MPSPAPSPRLGPCPLCARPTGLPPPAACCPVTGSGRPWLCALAGPVLKRGSDPGGSCSPHPPTLSSTSPDPNAGTHPFSQRPPPPGPSLPAPQTLLALGTPAHRGSRPPGWALTESELPSTLDSDLRRPGSGRPLPGPAQRWCSSHLKAVAGRQPSLEGQDLLQGPGTLAGPGRPRPDSAQGGTVSSQQSWAPASSLPAGRGALPAQSAFRGSGARPPPSSQPGQPGFVTSQAEVTRGQCWAFHTSRCRPSLARRLPAAQSRTMPAGPRGGGM